mmetsp:Transcript_2119/g.6029  ORF Transcript_2119/g.6029 Transcript_2119/m.6029 type:complete len:646 (-) Transcript_2119:160-2097(-)
MVSSRSGHPAMACELSFEASLAAMAAAYKALEAENLRLQEELRTMMATESQSAHAQALAQAHPHAKDMCASEHSKNHFGRVFQADDQALLNEKRNAKAADLMQLIADIDPEEQGDWASAALEADHVVELLKSRPGAECTKEEAEALIQKFRDYSRAQEPPIEFPTRLQLVSLTNVDDLENIFGPDAVERVMELQNAIAHQVSDELVDGNKPVRQSIHFNSTADFTRNMLKEDVHILIRETTKLDIVDTLGTCFVVLNTLILGISTDVTPRWSGWDFISATFALIFLAELVAKIVLSGGFAKYFSGDSLVWRLFDTAVILVALSDVVVLAIVAGEEEVNSNTITLVRIVRLVRLTRITRLGHTSVFHELAYMIRGIEAGTSTLVWAVVLLVIVCYVGAIILTQTIGRNDSDIFKPYAEHHFTSVTLSMFTLFRCFTGDCSCYDGLPLSYILYAQYGEVSIVVYWVLVMVVTLGLFNVMIANFLQNSQRAARFNDAERRRVLRKERKMVHEKTTSLMNRIVELQADNGGHRGSMSDLKISRDVFRSLLKDRQIHRWLDDMGCADGMRETLFDKIDRDGNGVLNAQELVSGVVDLLCGRFDGLEKVTNMLRSIQARLVEMEGSWTAVQRPSPAETFGSFDLSCHTAKC